MQFYNYIFAAGYECEIRNREDFIPWCVPLGEVLSVMGLNIFTSFFFFLNDGNFSNSRIRSIVFTSIGLLIYYLRDKRHRQFG